VSAGISGLTPNTTYHYRDAGQNAGGTIYGNDMIFTTSAYCLPSYLYGCTYGYALNSFILGTINTGAIACSGSPSWYHDFTAQSTTLQTGTGYTLTVQATGYNIAVNVYIDYNQNNTFDAGELVGQVICTNPATDYTITFTVPGNAISGITRMRALSEYYYYPSGPCGSQTYGNCCDFDVNVSTIPIPVVTTTAATSITASAATLNGTVNANGLSTNVTFQYGLTTGYGSTVTALQSPVTGTTVMPVSAGITGLTPNTLYHYRCVGVNSGGTVNGNDMTFTTPMSSSYCLPSYSTGCTSGDGLTSFILGTINTGTIACSGSPSWYHDYTSQSATLQVGSAYTLTVQTGNAGTYVNVYIDYNHNNAFDAGELIGQVSCVSSGTNYAINFSIPGTALTGTTRLRALTENGSYPAGPCASLNYGNCCDFTVNIIIPPPTITTTAASAITINSSTLNGLVNPNGYSTTVTFQYGQNTTYGTTVPALQNPVTGITVTPVSSGITGLTPNTLYHYRCVGVNTGGTVNGDDMTFTTLNTLLSESFESASIGQTPPAGWAVDLVSGGNYTSFQANGTLPTCTPPDGVRMVEFQSYSASSGTENRLKRTTPVSTVGYSNIGVDFKWSTDNGYSGYADRVNVQWSTNGTTWTTAATVNRYAAGSQAWTTQTVSLPSGAAGQATLYIAFDFISALGNNCHLDLVHITGVGP